MSTQQNLNDSDSEDDDYVPPPDADSGPSDVEPESKRARTSSPQINTADETAKKHLRERQDLWARFHASVSNPPAMKPAEPPKPTIKIEKRYRFAGEDVLEVVDVPEDSEDAKKWPKWHPPDNFSSDSTSTSTLSNLPTPLIKRGIGSTASKKVGPRKPRTSLPSLPTSSQKVKKLSTLDKSAMDWNAHIDAEKGSGLKDELEANRRSGGYLEKVEFLKRVDERKDDVIEAAKGSKRRRGV